MKRFVAKDSDQNIRLDVFVAEKFTGISRATIKKLCDQGKVLVNNSVKKPKYTVKQSDEVTVDYEINSLKDVPNIGIPIIYEDEDCLVLNKPLGILTHSKGAFNPEATVATFIESKLDKKYKGDRADPPAMLAQRAGIVHRLDRATSGVMICAKTPKAMSWLQKQFSTRNVKKSYLAVINGKLDPPEAIIDMPIERNPKKPQTFRVGSNGKTALTTYKTLSFNDEYSLIMLTPKTGRTHQLRVHLKHLGHPIVGDTFYDGEPADRLYLHASMLEITLTSKQRKVFSVPKPPEFKKLIKN